MTTNAPFIKIKNLLFPKKASPEPPKAPSPGIKLVSKENPEFNRALDEAIQFQAGFGEGFNAGLQYATSLLESITKEK